MAGARNFISGNAEGVMITGSATTGTVVAGNLIGTDVEGTAAVGNLTAGIARGRDGHHHRRSDRSGPQRDLGERRATASTSAAASRTR